MGQVYSDLIRDEHMAQICPVRAGLGGLFCYGCWERSIPFALALSGPWCVNPEVFLFFGGGGGGKASLSLLVGEAAWM